MGGERLFGGSTTLMNYKNIATTVFTPLEYSVIGYSEEEAIAKFGEENIEVYHMQAYAVAIAMGATKSDFDRTVGIHPTTSELFTTMTITKRSGQPLPKGGCPSCA